MPSGDGRWIDQIVGEQIRNRRKELRLSQATVAASLGISSQQIQKYEAGQNRVSVGRLFDFMTLFEVDASYFFDAIKDVMMETDEEETPFETGVEQPAIDRLTRAFRQIRDPDVRDGVTKLIEVLSRSSSG